MENIRTIYCDFDGTITKKDAVNSFLEKYTGNRWLTSEKLWIEGKITSVENLTYQVGLLPELTTQQVDDFINSIEIDNYFVEFTEFLKEKNIKLVILSDGFDMFIKKTLKKHNISGVEVYANHVIHDNNGKFKIEFPYFNKNCDKGSGMCKCAMVKEKDFCYIGDGTSDICVAHKAKILFAKKTLCEYCNNNHINYISFNSFSDIIKVLKNR